MQSAIAITAPGGPEVLQLRKVEVPVPADDELLIDVAFAGVNRHDCNQRRRGPVPAHSDIPGLEVAGIVRGLGAQARGFAIGQRVCALVDGGGYAQYVCAPATHAFAIDGELPLEQAAALPEAMFTVWHNLFGVGRLGAGESVLIHGGTSGVGSIAIQVLRRFGHAVYATCGSQAKCDQARALGAVAIDYRAERFTDAVAAYTAGRGVDVVLDMAGGSYGPENIDALAMRGRLVHLSPGQDAEFHAPLRAVMAKQACITGSLLRPLPAAEKTLIAQALSRAVWPLVLQGEVRPVIADVLGLADAGEAHRRLERGEVIGKLVLRVQA